MDRTLRCVYSIYALALDLRMHRPKGPQEDMYVLYEQEARVRTMYGKGRRYNRYVIF